MDTYDAFRKFKMAAQKIEIEIPSYLECDYDKMISCEIKEIDEKRCSYSDKVSIASDRMINWFINANDYRINLSSIKTVREFVASHRIACVWSILLRLELEEGK